MNLGPLLIRADASVAIGTGHVIRCLALAQAWQDAGGKALFAIAQGSQSLQDYVRAEGCKVLGLTVDPGGLDDSRRTAILASEQEAKWVVLDGYHFRGDFQQRLKTAGLRVLLLDDNGESDFYSADLVLNQNAHAADSTYQRRARYTRLLLGVRYTLFRREFTAWHNWKRQVPTVAQKLLLTFGGSDPGNYTRAAIETIRRIDVPRLEVVVVQGGSNPHASSTDLAASSPHRSFRVEREVRDMAKLMAWADVCVSAAGTTSLEACLMGLPSVVVTVAPNQVNSARELRRRGCVIHIDGRDNANLEGLAEELVELMMSRELRQRMSDIGRDLVDGLGAQRVIAALRGA